MMKSNGVKMTDLPWCVGVYLLRCSAYLQTCDLKWCSTFTLVSQESILAAAPAISPEKNAATQCSLSTLVLTEFVRHHSSKKSESDFIKEKLGELLRGFQLFCTTSTEMQNIITNSATLMHPSAHGFAEVSSSLTALALDMIKDSNSVVRALANLPPSEKLFVEACAYADQGAFSTFICDRVTGFMDREDFKSIESSFETDVKNFRTQRAPVLEIFVYRL